MSELVGKLIAEKYRIESLIGEGYSDVAQAAKQTGATVAARSRIAKLYCWISHCA